MNKNSRKSLKIEKTPSSLSGGSLSSKNIPFSKKPKNPSEKTSAISNTPQELLTLFQQMLLIRRFEENAGKLYGMGLIAGFCHLYNGQEAVVVGVQSMLQPEDAVITAYRDHGHMLACGMDPRRVMAELTGRRDGYSKGKGGSMHMFSREKNFFGGHGIVGAQVPLGTGLAFAQKYKKSPGVSVVYMGDGAANQGQVYESFNMAALWSLPVLYIIENNHYAMGTSVNRATSSETFHTRGAPWGIPGKKVNGMDVLAVQKAAGEALSSVRSGRGPYLLEIETYRYRGHSMSDPGTYRPKEELETMRSTRDPIETFKRSLLEGGQISEEVLKAVETRLKDLMKEVVEFAQKCPEPEAQELTADVLLEN